MSGISDDSLNPDAAVLAVVRLVQRRLDAGPINGGEADELMSLFLKLIETCISDVYPALSGALARAQKLPLPGEVLDELWAADVKTHKGLDSASPAIDAMRAAGEDKVQILRRAIAAMEHISDEARSLTRRVDRLLEESGSRSG